MSLLEITAKGLYYKPADAYIDPYLPVDKALITHAHSDHARKGSFQYLCSLSSLDLVKSRVYSEHVSGIKYGEKIRIGEATVSFHPAGHILGSSQIRLEHKGHITVISGDYKLEADPSCEAFEPIPCNHFVTECTFGLPIYNWEKSEIIFDQINQWWLSNRQEGKTSIIFAYALGKAQRIISQINAEIGPIGLHALNSKFIAPYKKQINIPDFLPLNTDTCSILRGQGLVICPASIQKTNLLKNLEPYSLANASGWMLTSKAINQGNYDKGFVLSDHADWEGLIQAVEATKAEEVWCTHGFTSQFSRYLKEKGYLSSDIDNSSLKFL